MCSGTPAASLSRSHSSSTESNWLPSPLRLAHDPSSKETGPCWLLRQQWSWGRRRGVCSGSIIVIESQVTLWRLFLPTSDYSKSKKQKSERWGVGHFASPVKAPKIPFPSMRAGSDATTVEHVLLRPLLLHGQRLLPLKHTEHSPCVDKNSHFHFYEGVASSFHRKRVEEMLRNSKNIIYDAVIFISTLQFSRNFHFSDDAKPVSFWPLPPY